MTTTTTKTPAQTTARKAPAKKAPAEGTKAQRIGKAMAAKAAKAPAKKAAPAERKLRWKLAAPKMNNKPEEQSASVEGHDYAIERSGDSWRATHTFDGKSEVLVEGGFGAAYNAAVKHNRERA